MDNNMILLIAAGVILVIFYELYVSLIKKKNNVKEATSGIEVQLKKRYDLIPNLLTMAKKYMEHEKSLMEEITKLRTQAVEASFAENPQKTMQLDNEIESKMKNLLLNAENYPDMKSDAAMVTAMQSFNEVEEHVAAARRFYNSSVKELKNAVEIFPSSMVAKLINIKADMPFFEAESEAKIRVDAGDFFK